MITKFNSHGVYHVGENIYLNKTEAAYRASIQGKPLTWDFHNSTYSKFDWTHRPPGTLRDLYRERAQQIRDMYDHVVIPFSGGMDSYTVLHSFLINNIHVDEIWTNWPLKQMKYQRVNDQDQDEYNLLSEFKYAVMPVLEFVRKNFPKTNIVINDYSSEYETDFKEETFRMSTSWQSPSSPYRGHGRSDMCDQALKQNKRVARVYGYDKTKIRVVNNKIYAFFIDFFGSGEILTGETSEFFYHSPSAPLIPILQAHCIRDVLEQYTTIENIPKNTRGPMNSVYVEACYPDYNVDTFQTGKPLGTLHRRSDAWIAEYNPRYHESWLWAYNQYYANIDNSLLDTHNEKVVGLKYCSSPNYLVGDIKFPNFESL